MRRCLKYVILLLALLSPALVLAQSGQEDEATDRAETRQKPVTFVAIMPEGSHLTDQQKLALQNKVERIIAKNKVAQGLALRCLASRPTSTSRIPNVQRDWSGT